jgi:hypothetical protein
VASECRDEGFDLITTKGGAMNSLAKCSLMVFGITAACVQGRAQITITNDDVNAKLAAGNIIQNIQDTLTTSANIGAPGATSWDFSGLHAHMTTTLTSVDAATTPYISQFPGANHALKTSLSGNIPGAPGPVSGDLYLYLVVGTNLLSPGQMGGGTVELTGVGTFNGEIRFRNTPSDTTYALPSTLGSHWGSTYTSNDTIWIYGVPFIGTLEIDGTPADHSLSYDVDAYGPMTIPGGSVHEALRIKKTDRVSENILGWIFLAKDGASVQLATGDQVDNGTISVVRTSITWSPAFTTGVAEAPSEPRTFSLAQNYPNPFNPSTTIRFSLPSATDVTLQVFDPLGRTVATLADGKLEAGEHQVVFNGAGFASGVYFYRLTAGGFVQTKSMMIIK